MRSSMHISLPRPLKSWVERQVISKGYSTTSEYLRDVLRKEQEQETRARIEAKMIAALDSGPPTPMTREDWDHIRREGLKRAKARRKR
jgi:antitoxin ParD1/3/4